jgi:hypothetical protein
MTPTELDAARESEADTPRRPASRARPETVDWDGVPTVRLGRAIDLVGELLVSQLRGPAALDHQLRTLAGLQRLARPEDRAWPEAPPSLVAEPEVTETAVVLVAANEPFVALRARAA